VGLDPIALLHSHFPSTKEKHSPMTWNVIVWEWPHFPLRHSGLAPESVDLEKG
jgi:hypothetical protein